MGSLDRPKLRPLAARRCEHEGRLYAALEDPLGAFNDPVLIPFEGFQLVVRHFDGRKSLGEIRDRLRSESGQDLTPTELEVFVSRLDRAMVLDGPTFRGFCDDFARQTARPSAFAGRSYPSSATALRAQLDRYFAHPAGAGRPGARAGASGARLRGVAAPHIDFGRGGPVYTWAYRALVERSDAEVFVVLGVAHQPCERRFALTRKDFETPLGLVPADRGFIDLLAGHAGESLFDDELVHRTEHSVEFQAVFLQHLLGGRRPFTVVPVLVGSFHDLMVRGVDPIRDPEVARFVDALRRAEATCGKRVLYLGSIDLSHVGPEFGDPAPVSDRTLGAVRAADHAMLDRAAANDPAGWFRTAAAVGNRYRVCGLSATYTLLHAMGPTTGRLLKYDQAVNESRSCCVSFASLTFEAEPVVGGGNGVVRRG